MAVIYDDRKYTLQHTLVNYQDGIRHSRLSPSHPKKKSTDSANVNDKYKIGIQEVLAAILKSGDLGSWTKNGVLLDYADGFRRLSHPILCGWMADHPEKMNLLGFKTNICSDCEVRHEDLGTYPNSAPRRDPEQYKRKSAIIVF